MIPSSDQMASDSSPNWSRMRADSASPQAACTRPPKGESTHSRQSPISSRKRSITIVRSLGHDARGLALLAQVGDQVGGGALVQVVLRRSAPPARGPPPQRENSPIALPSSAGRPTPSPFQKGRAPGAPGAGVTITRSRVISSIRQVEAPSRKVWPGRAS